MIILFGAFSAVIEYLFEWLSEDPVLTNIYLFQLFLYFTLSYVRTIKQLGYLHIFSLLHITTFIFAFGGIVVSLVTSGVDYKISISPLYIKFQEVIVQKTILLYTIYVTFSYLFFFIFYNKIGGGRNTKETFTLKTKDSYLKTGKITMWLMLPFAFIYSYTLFKLLSQNRVLMFQLGSNSALGLPFYLRMTNLFFTTGFFLIIASAPPKKIFIKYSLLYMIPLIPILLMGERGQVVGTLIFILWYLYRVYRTKFNITRLVVIALIIMIVSYIISLTRLGHEIESTSLSYLISGFLSTSASSFSLLSYYILFKKEVIPHNYPFFLDSLIGGLTGVTGQSLKTLEVRSSIGHHLMYTLNPDYYLSGASRGTSFIAEAFEFGVVGVIISTLLLAIFIHLVNKYMLQKHFRMIFIYMFFQAIILSPRGSLLPSIYEIIKYTLAFLLLITIYNILKPLKYGKS